MTGQFGKNHLGDRDEMLPTNHGFDEFFGNLYHLNAEEEPENPTIRRTRRSRSASVRAASSTASPTAASPTPAR
jgi:arylsulfatase A-like enzyme